MKSLLCLFMAVAALCVSAQNKTLGVGTATLNPNAALHVESPTGNQGILIPRLSTTQRNGLASALAAVDVGLIVFDTDVRALAIWNGTGWDIGSRVGAPIAISNDASNGSAAVLENSNVANGSAALTVNTAGTGNAIETSGRIQAGQFIGNGSALTNLPAASKLAIPLIDTLNTIPDTGSAIRLVNNNTATGSFGLINLTNLNSNNNFSPLFIENRGLNGATDMVINNPANTNDVVGAITNGLGRGGFFNVNNTANTSAAVFGTTNGPGRAIHGTNTGAGNGFAGLFQNTNAANTFPAIQANTVGTGPGVRVLQNATSLGSGMDVILQNTTGNAIGFSLNQQGLGGGANFSITNPASTSASLVGTTTGTGAAIQGTTASGFAAVYGRRDGATNGHAGSFEITNAGNAFPAMTVSTVGTGSAGFFFVNNAASSTAALAGQTIGSGVATQGFTTGTGSAGRFEINNPANTSPALFATTNGTGNAITAAGRVQATQFVGDGSLLTGISSALTLPYLGNSAVASNTFEINNNSPSFAKAGRFSINNAANGGYAVEGATNGDGAGLLGISYGAGAGVWGESTNGNAGRFNILNAASTSVALTSSNQGLGSTATFGLTNNANSSPTVSVFNGGTGPATRIDVSNLSNSSPALLIQTNGTGNAITANRPIQATSFIGDGSALTGLPTGFSIPYTNSVSNAGSLFSLTNSSTGTGSGAIFETTNGTNSGNALTANSASGGGGLALSVNASGVSTAMRINATNPGNNQAALNIAHSGTGNAITANRPINISNTTANGGAASFQIANSSNTDVALSASTVGNSAAGVFSVNNISSTGYALVANSNGLGAFRAQNTNAGSAGLFVANSPSTAAVQISNSANIALSAFNDGANGGAASFSVNNASNSSTVLNITSTGTGNAITANRPIQATSFIGDGSALTGVSGLTLPFSQTDPGTTNSFSITKTGSGFAAQFFINNASNGASAITGTTNGTGYASQFSVSNPSNLSGAVYASSTGGGGAVIGEMTGTGRAGDFRIVNPANSWPAVRSQTDGVGAAVEGTTTGSGVAGSFAITAGSNGSSILNAFTSGTGRGVNLTLSNPSNSSPGINIQHSGTGNAITANRPIQATQFIGDGSQLTNVLPAGLILPFGGATPPSGYLVCDGSEVSRTAYAALFAAIGTAWGIGNGSTTFNLPDLRGRFLRGVDGSAGNDPDAAARTANNGGNTGNSVGSYQGDAFSSHLHITSSQANGNLFGNSPFGTQASSGTTGFGFGGYAGNVGTSGINAAQTSFTGGSETRPKNANVNYIIKF